MVSIRRHTRAGAILAAAVSLTGMLWLSGCEQQPYPTSGQAPAAESPKAPPPALAGAPSYAPPPAPAPQAYAPPPYTPPARNPGGVAIVAMAPIPNPGDPGSEEYYKGTKYDHSGHRVVHHYGTAAAQPPVIAKAPKFAPKAAVVAHKAPAPKPPVVVAKVAPPKPVVQAAKAPPPAPKPVPAKAATAKPAPVVIPAPPVVAAVVPPKPAPAAVAAAKPVSPPPVAAPAPAAAPGDRPAHISALQAALADAISKGAVLTAPERFTANQPADVSLTVPAGFADTVRNEAQKDSLSDAAASVNITAVLSGDGFSVTPDESQSQPMTVGQPTVYRWTVTAQPGAKGPLHADVGAELLGAGSDTLALGSVQKQAGPGVKATPRIIGAAILFLILALAVVWLARGRGPARSASARRASQAARNAPGADAGAPGN